ncbi:hypothetical protein JEP98_00605 [Providencia rettgeri]|uniref:hypothetical protein n=1 Tax=Providencia rettgeri TaxID=587 RepID=UPI0018E43F6C|nr:hypothetical protein [Providencia rettgeri]MBI6187663.1 hypothetical protein [Providencia rettgeri]
MSHNLMNKKNKLEIAKVILRESSFSINKNLRAAFLESALDSGENKTESYEGTACAHLLSGKGADECVYIFEFECASRVVKITDSDGNPVPESADVRVVYTVKAVFEASYISSVKLTDEELNAFAENDVVHHIWPYWREYFQNACSRMEAPKLQVPLSNGY